MFTPGQHIVDYVDDYLHGVLPSADIKYVEAHCAECKICRVALEEAEQRHAAMKAIPPVEAPEELVQKTIERVDAHAVRRARRRKIFRRVVLYATAASVLIIGGLNLYFYNLAPSPYDLRLLGQDDLLAGSVASLRVRLLDRSSAKPLAGVPVELALFDPETKETVQLVSATTDQQGTAGPKFALPDWKDGAYTLRVVALTPRAEELTRTIKLRRDWKLMLSSDKPVYKPGQTIHVRSLALRRPDLKPVAGEQVTFTITDPAGNVIFKQHDVTSRHGIASADCPLATEIIEGSYQVQCQVGQTSSNRTVEVQKYVLPKFKIEIELDKPFYQPGEQVTGNLQADYFFGKSVAAGDVKIQVEALAAGPDRITEITDKTDENGRLEFRFALPDHMVGREQDDGAARFNVFAEVVDTAGQVQRVSASRVVTSDPIVVEVIPEAGTLVQGVANTVYVYTSYADGRPAKTRLVVHGVSEEINTSSLGVASFEVTPEKPAVGLTIKATDNEGRVGRRHLELDCGQVSGDFLVRPDKAVYRGGDTMTLVALGGGVEPVLVDLIKDGQTMLAASIEMTDGRGQLDIDLPPDLFGTVELCAYRFNASGLAARRSRMIYIRQARELNIEATLDKDQYRPGASVKLRLALRDQQGQPAPGAISLAAVDEAVFHVLRQSTGLAQSFFLLERELLQPVYAIYNWVPGGTVDVPQPDLVQLEQALFSTTAQVAVGDGEIFRDAGAQGRAQEEPFAMEEIAEDVMIEDMASPVMVSRRSPFTLAAASYEAKVQDVRSQRRRGLEGVTIAWCLLAVCLLLVGVVTFAVYKPKAFAWTAGGCFVLIVVPALLLPALNTVRESARMAEPQAEMMWDAAGADAMDEADMAIEATLEDVATTEEPADTEPGAAPSAPPRVRQWFPETLLWRPELVTNDDGVAELDVALADSITTWRLSASAVSVDGDLGGAEFPIRVFQPFFVDLNLPVALTRNDEVEVPVVVYNYLDKPQTVELQFEQADWYRRQGEDDDAETDVGPLKLDLQPGEVRSLGYRIKVEKVGRHQLQVTASGSGIADAVRREIEVVPDGRREEQVASGALDEPLEMTLAVPDDAIEGSVRAVVKLYPSAFSQLVEGLDAIFQMPYGCFEQTSSTTYPNVLALDYLRRTDKNAPAVEAKSRQYIHIGYQRLVSFEVSGGGFDWFGNPPANQTLTAYGLMEFVDMARVHDVDPNLIQRTRDWLLSKRRADGSWQNEAGMLNDGLAGSVQRGRDLNLATTAYIAWAVFGGGEPASATGATLDYLLAHSPGSIQDPYLLATVANAIAAIDNQHPQLGAYLAQLDSLKQTGADGKKCWWNQAEHGSTMFYGRGQAGSIETTAMAVLAMTSAKQHPATTRNALRWLIEQKDDRGTWHSTQATVLALKALLAGTGSPLGEEKPRQIELTLDDQPVRTVDIPVNQADVMQQIDLSDMLTTPGEHHLRVTDATKAGTAYQVTFRYHVEDTASQAQPDQPLTIAVTYDRTHLAVDDRVICEASIKNNLPATAPMVIVDLPIPGGFVIERGELDELVGSKKIARYQITPRKAILYLRELSAGDTLKLRYRLKATMPVKVAVPPVQAYHYYEPDQRGIGGATQLEATEA